MEVLLVILTISLFVIGYFFIGVLLKFLWGWFPAIIFIPVSLLIMFQGGVFLAVVGIVIFFSAILSADKWQDTGLHDRVERRLEAIFYFKD